MSQLVVSCQCVVVEAIMLMHFCNCCLALVCTSWPGHRNRNVSTCQWQGEFKVLNNFVHVAMYKNWTVEAYSTTNSWYYFYLSIRTKFVSQKAHVWKLLRCEIISNYTVYKECAKFLRLHRKTRWIELTILKLPSTNKCIWKTFIAFQYDSFMCSRHKKLRWLRICNPWVCAVNKHSTWA